MWVPFNEGWGQPDAAGTREMAEWTARYDPTAPREQHLRLDRRGRGPRRPTCTNTPARRCRPSSAVARPCSASSAASACRRAATPGRTRRTGATSASRTRPNYERAYREKIAQLRLLVATRPERGHLHADHRRRDRDQRPDDLRPRGRSRSRRPRSPDIHKTLYATVPAVTTVLPTSELEGRTWRYTTDGPGRRRGRSPGSTTARGRPARRRSAAASPRACRCARHGPHPASGCASRFDWAGGAATDSTSSSPTMRTPRSSSTASKPRACRGHATGYVMVPVAAGRRRALKQGRNVIAVHCQQKEGAQAIDVGIVRVQ